MSDADGLEGNNDMTLALDAGAIEALADPRAAVADARRWSSHVGVVSMDPDAAAAAVSEYDIHQDFVVGELDALAVLSKLRWEADTARFVYVGSTGKHRALADHVGWEYVSVSQAADRAGWSLAGEVADTGVLDRLAGLLRRLRP